MQQSSGFVHRTFKLSRGSLDCFVAGEGPDVICLHGAAGMEIRSVAQRLGNRFRVWLPVVPGYEGTLFMDGVNTIPDVADMLAEFIEHHIGKPCEVVGHSMGARIAAWLAILHPARVEQLVLMAPAGFRPMDAPPLSFERETMLRQMVAHSERQPVEVRTDAMIEANRKAMQHYGAGQSRDEALIARIGEIQASALILGGSKDVRVPAAAVQLLRSKIRRSSLVYVYDAAHLLEVDQPERVALLVEDFLIRGEAFIVKGTPGPQEIAA